MKPMATARTISDLLAADHRRLDGLFEKSFVGDEDNRRAHWDEFREGLLRHIGIEETCLFPTLRQLRDPKVLSLLKRLHSDHAALSAILVLSPNPNNAERIETLLEPHNEIEEGPQGLYVLCDELPSDVRNSLLKQALVYPKVKIKPSSDTGVARRNADKMFEEAIKARKENLNDTK